MSGWAECMIQRLGLLKFSGCCWIVGAFEQPVKSGTMFGKIWEQIENWWIQNAGWWFGTFGLFFHFIYGMSSFPLTFIFFRRVGIPPIRTLWKERQYSDLRGGFESGHSYGIMLPPKKSPSIAKQILLHSTRVQFGCVFNLGGKTEFNRIHFYHSLSIIFSIYWNLYDSDRSRSINFCEFSAPPVFDRVAPVVPRLWLVTWNSHNGG